MSIRHCVRFQFPDKGDVIRRRAHSSALFLRVENSPSQGFFFSPPDSNSANNGMRVVANVLAYRYAEGTGSIRTGPGGGR
jgi:hypothetical protein